MTWFGLNPVRRSSLALSVAVVGICIATLPSCGHVEYREMVARKLQPYYLSLHGAGEPWGAGHDEAVYYATWTGVKAPKLGRSVRDMMSWFGSVSLKDFRGKRLLLYSFHAGDFNRAPDLKQLIKTIETLNRVRAEVGRGRLAVVGFTRGCMYLKPSRASRLFTSPDMWLPAKHRKQIDFPVVNAYSRFDEPYNLLRYPSGIVIDRNGIIQKIYTEPMSEEDLREAATGPDWDGPVRPAPTLDLWAGKGPPTPAMKAVRVWVRPIKAVVGMTVGDWDLDGSLDVLAVTADGELLILSPDGTLKDELPPVHDPFLPWFPVQIEWAIIEGGRSAIFVHKMGGTDDVAVRDRWGQLLWRYKTINTRWGGDHGVDSATWADLDGDGYSELLVGFNGDGGFHLVSGQGSRIWRDTEAGNVWSVAGIAPRDGRPGLAFCTDIDPPGIRVYDAKGKLLRRLSGGRHHLWWFSAAEMDSKGLRQIAGVFERCFGDIQYVGAIDLEGKPLWHFPVPNPFQRMRPVPPPFLAADATGDGTKEWVMSIAHGRSLQQAVFDVAGGLVASVVPQEPDDCYVSCTVVPRRRRPALFIFGGHEQMVAYTLEPFAPEEADGADGVRP